MIRFFLSECHDYGVGIALSNLRFQVAYRLGGFTRAWTYEPHELLECPTCGQNVPKEDVF